MWSQQDFNSGVLMLFKICKLLFGLNSWKAKKTNSFSGYAGKIANDILTKILKKGLKLE
ncbi:hypothetical protein QIA36_05025 (plasmid) [Borreliella yangtzensis]|uniref:hypothetical protein n=1 Tax=Borreliella yangtzensis TaxID=683292 RepID=UPI003B21D3E1